MKKSQRAPVITSITPVCFRIPKPGQTDPYFGGTRTFWFERTRATEANNFTPDVKSRLVKRHPGAKTGIRFIDFKSAVDWFEKQSPAAA
jgi:hypothetical protein